MIERISDETKNLIKQNSAQSLPDSPTLAGMKPYQIKRALSDMVLGENGMINEVNRIVDEANKDIGEVQEQSEQAKKTLQEINKVVVEANEATERADKIAQDLEYKKQTDYYRGEPGLGSGVFAMRVKDGNLMLYQEHIDNVNFNIREDGYLTIKIGE